jgi:hypothetical protein
MRLMHLKRFGEIGAIMDRGEIRSKEHLERFMFVLPSILPSSDVASSDFVVRQQ